jgi:hypothetical protein
VRERVGKLVDFVCDLLTCGPVRGEVVTTKQLLGTTVDRI